MIEDKVDALISLEVLDNWHDERILDIKLNVSLSCRLLNFLLLKKFLFFKLLDDINLIILRVNCFENITIAITRYLFDDLIIEYINYIRLLIG